MRILLTALLLSLTLIFSTFANTLEEAKKAVKSHDYETAFSIYKPLADNGLDEAQYALGEMYSKGFGTEQNVEIATEWFEKAAEQGHLLAQLQAGRIYFLITEDLVKAHKWLNIIAERKIENAKKLQLIAKQMRNDIAKEMTPEQITEAEKLAEIWLSQQ